MGSTSTYRNLPLKLDRSEGGRSACVHGVVKRNERFRGRLSLSFGNHWAVMYIVLGKERIPGTLVVQEYAFQVTALTIRPGS